MAEKQIDRPVRFKNQSRVIQVFYLPSVHSKLIGRRLDGSALGFWDEDADGGGRGTVEPGAVVEVTDQADIELLRALTRERDVRVLRGHEVFFEKRPGFFVEVD